MPKTSILEREEYTQLFIYIYKKKLAKASDVTKDLKQYFKDRRNFGMKINEMRNKDFIITEDYGRYAKYRINEIGVFNYWIKNYVPETINQYFMNSISKKSPKEQDKIIKAFMKVLFRHISIFSHKSEIYDGEHTHFIKNIKKITKEERPKKIEPILLPHGSLKDAFESLRDNFLLDGLLNFSQRKRFIPF